MKHKNGYNASDQPLVEQVLHGDADAFRIIIKNTEGLVTQIIFKMISGAEDRKDLVQDIYLKIFQKLGTFNFQSKLSTWIAHIAYNTCINHLKKKKLLLINESEDNTGPDDESWQLMEKGINLFTNETEKIIFGKQLSEILNRETDKLSPVYRTLITLYHHEELSYAEIGEIMELPEGTVKNYLFRARKALRNNLLLTYKKEGL